MTPAIRPQERLLLELVPELHAPRLLCNSAGWAQFAAAYARHHISGCVNCWFLDLYQCQQSRNACSPLPANLRLLCQPDPPGDDVDAVVWAFSRQGDGELAREMLQAGHERLALGGRLVAAIDNPRDQWLHAQLQNVFAKVTRRPSESGVVYQATKTEPLKKKKHYAAEFAFRDADRLIRLRTRPSVFSHRQLDGGARALLKAMPACDGAIIDLGCGSGAVGVAAALRAGGRVLAVDSNPRAVEATAWAQNHNGVDDRMLPLLDCDGSSVPPNSHDLVLANPPYYSDHRIARLFMQTAVKALVQGGRLVVVTKSPKWYLEQLPRLFHHIEARDVGGFVVVQATKS